MRARNVAIVGSVYTMALLAGCADDSERESTSTITLSSTQGSTGTTSVVDPTGEPTSSGTTSTSGSGSTSEGVTTGPPPPLCGDGVIDPDEACDDANQDDTDACLTTCVAATCGDAHVQAGVEECDAGPMNGDDQACTSLCKNAVCGDSLVLAGAETCDDGNLTPDDGCNELCAEETCGDGKKQASEECDDGNADDTDTCLSTCFNAKCGDGQLQAGIDMCDDGNLDETDMCTTLCKAPACDDLLKSGTESDVDCGGMCLNKCGVDKACAAGTDCGTGFCANNLCKIATNCAQIKTQDAQATSGVYTIDPDGNGGKAPFDVYCNMTIDNGGWALVLNLDTSDGHVMWWGNTKWNDGTTKGTVANALTEDHVNIGWNDYSGAKELLLVVHNEGTVVGWKSFAKATTDPMRTHMMGGDNTLLGSSVKASDTAQLWSGERLVRLSTTLYANHCVQTGGQCTSGATGSPDGDRIGSHEASPADNVGGGLGNWHDMNYCCNGNYGSGKTCNGQALRTASEAQAGWAMCYGGLGHFGTDTFGAATNTCNNNNCAQANWAQASGQVYDYSLYLR